MLISRGANLLNHISKHARRKNILTNNQPSRFSHEWIYRDTNLDTDKKWIIAAEIAGGFAWWWVLYRFWYDYQHITGHWKYPDVSEWTDAELGIPPDYN
ncbi:hypothetical protein KPH14_002587 [Odynerus spinipes]|uniref:NADH dehydrogenase [ubiquinone] 1 beta subcomplex subunit 2, mitochondrial n=1 Tax=Odynerus spinipes TaxID=1348599 RepID=A0AAD9VLQ1_9HYME|nr:hypothetical protein KPH14_002587 [Odynerus spinipes]